MKPEEKEKADGKDKRRDSGFTLVEILTVALIIVIIATFAFPSYRKSRQRALETAGVHGMKSFAAAMEEYYNYHGSYATSFNALKSAGLIDSNYNTLANDFIELRVTDGGNVMIKRYADGNFWRPT